MKLLDQGIDGLSQDEWGSTVSDRHQDDTDLTVLIKISQIEFGKDDDGK